MRGQTAPHNNDMLPIMPGFSLAPPPHGQSQSLSLGQLNEGKNGFCVDPLPGFHFSMCYPMQQPISLHKQMHCDTPIIVAILFLEGRCAYALGGEDKSAYDMQKNMFMIGRWTNKEITINRPAQSMYGYAGFIIQESTLEKHFGRGLSDDVQRILRRSLKNGAGQSTSITGIAKPDVIVTALQILSMRREAGDDSLRCRCAVFDLFAKLLHGVAEVDQEPNVCLREKDIERLRTLKTIIEENFRTIDSALDACSKIGMNFSKANKGFKSLYATTIAKYIQQCKMVYAYSSMRKMQYCVSECAFAIGYTNISYFISAFKKNFGMTPKAVSRLGTKGESEHAASE